MKYPSKIDRWLAGVVLAGGLVALYGIAMVMIHSVPGQWFIVAPLVLLSLVLPLWIFTRTFYVLDDVHLKIHSGPFSWSVPLRDIRSFEPTRNPLSSPALSLDRLEIRYGDSRSVMVSPRDKAAFVADLERRRLRAR